MSVCCIKLSNTLQHTALLFSQLLKDVIPVLRCITDREAVNAGIFLYETYKTLNYWRSSEKVRG